MLQVGSEPVWQLKRGQTVYKRISDRELLLLVELGHLKPGDLLRKPGLGGWKSAEALSWAHYYASAAIRPLVHRASVCGADKGFAGCRVGGCHPLPGQGDFDRETSCSVLEILFAAQLSTLGEKIRSGQRPPSCAGSDRTADRAGVSGVYWRRRSGLLRDKRKKSNRTHASYKAAGPPNRSACVRYGEANENLQFPRVAARSSTSSVAISL